MNHWLNEKMAEFHREDILIDSERIRLIQLATHSQADHPGLFTRTMYIFANWMINTGNELRRRYEVPPVECNHKPSNSYAQ